MFLMMLTMRIVSIMMFSMIFMIAMFIMTVVTMRTFMDLWMAVMGACNLSTSTMRDMNWMMIWCMNPFCFVCVVLGILSIFCMGCEILEQVDFEFFFKYFLIFIVVFNDCQGRNQHISRLFHVCFLWFYHWLTFLNSNLTLCQLSLIRAAFSNPFGFLTDLKHWRSFEVPKWTLVVFYQTSWTLRLLKVVLFWCLIFFEDFFLDCNLVAEHENSKVFFKGKLFFLF